MTLGGLGTGYVAIGAGVALAIAALKRRLSFGDALSIVGLWPLYAPLAWARDAGREDELVAALARAQASPLAAVLPDAETARILGGRLREARNQLRELDEVLARPDFDPGAARRRAAELAARGASHAAATATLRVKTLGQLHALRERYRRELDEVRELIAQLVTQAELVRLQPAAAAASGDLVRELVARVEGLGELFSYQATLEYADREER